MEEIKRLKEQEGKDMILFGSARLASAFIRSGMVDAYHLWIHPVILGRGKPIFNDLQKQMNLKLKRIKKF
ncbi:MAG: dihydrofolate reductase family protein [Puia sp.]